MSGSLNKIQLIGNLGKDPELKMTPSGQPLARFSVATTETWKNTSGEKQSKTEWHNVVVWGKQAEIAEKWLRKGKQVYIEGRMQYREWTDPQGNKRNMAEVRCDNFVMLGRMEEGGRGGYTGGGASEYDEPLPPPPPSSGGYDEDIPF